MACLSISAHAGVGLWSNTSGDKQLWPTQPSFGEPSIWLRQKLLSGATVNVTVDPNDSPVWDRLNDMIKTGSKGLFTGGKGVMVRSLLDGVSSTVVPATFIVNDVEVPSSVYPSSGGGNGNPMCPCDSGSSGFGPGPNCPSGPGGERGPWNFAQIGAVVGSSMNKLVYKYDDIQSTDWGWGVFYATDSNSADQRCRWLQSYNGYDCPGGWLPNGGQFQPDSSKKGSGYYPAGNPYANAAWGGGTGCHFSKGGIDQTDAVDSQGNNLVQDYDCQCNYKLKTNGWYDWVDQWLQHATPKRGFEWQGWFGGGKAPSYAMDFAACWVNNPRDMIQLQNAIWSKRLDWSNEKLPTSHWSDHDAQSQRPYWGWNEVPVTGNLIDDPQNWDAIYIKLPAAVCGGGRFHKYDSVNCLTSGAKEQLETDIGNYVNNKILVPGMANVYKRPGSAVVFLNDEANYDSRRNLKYQRRFACENWESPNHKFKVVFDQSKQLCYVDWG